ncbi:MAG: hypothetical protein GEV07_14620 [Streptosporangiales bacterium]|nr:hypothetical protein [Streptosporangiales bacterium]
MNSATVRILLVHGMLAGAAAGLLAFGLAYLIGEPGVEAGLAYEDAHTTEHGMDLVSRGLQSTAGLATAVLVFGTAMGGLAALTFCVALGRLGRLGARATAMLIAAAAFVTVYLVPFLKYPANPPGSSAPDTIGTRTTLYFGMVALAVLAVVAAVIVGRRLARRLGTWNAAIAAASACIVVIAVVMVFLPTVNETPGDFPATALWQFRLASLGIQALLWASFGVIYGLLAEHVLEPRTARPAQAATAAATRPTA